jgi:hypothetical protein
VPVPSRVQITPQALASGLAIACLARSRPSGTPSASRRWQKPSISASVAQLSLASAISQLAIAAIASRSSAA